MLATIALGAAQVQFLGHFNTNNMLSSFWQNSVLKHLQLPLPLCNTDSLLQSPWGVASGAIAGHLVATSIAILGGGFLANYISEKLVRLF